MYHEKEHEEDYHMRCCITKVTKCGNRMKIIHEDEEEIKESKERKGRKWSTKLVKHWLIIKIIKNKQMM